MSDAFRKTHRLAKEGALRFSLNVSTLTLFVQKRRVARELPTIAAFPLLETHGQTDVEETSRHHQRQRQVQTTTDRCLLRARTCWTGAFEVLGRRISSLLPQIEENLSQVNKMNAFETRKFLLRHASDITDMIINGITGARRQEQIQIVDRVERLFDRIYRREMHFKDSSRLRLVLQYDPARHRGICRSAWSSCWLA